MENIIIPQEMLDRLSYHSTLGQSLKQISLSKTPIEAILADISKYRASYADIVSNENVIGSRFKSEDSLMRKYIKTLNEGGGFKQCFNDVLGFRIHLDEYPQSFPDYFRVADLRNGKKTDDGYRAIHLYYQRDSMAYPIEIQLWCNSDFLFNVWSHKLIYKYEDPQLGCELHQLYKDGKINSEEEFIAALEEARGR